jgi:hypothetical protein
VTVVPAVIVTLATGLTWARGPAWAVPAPPEVIASALMNNANAIVKHNAFMATFLTEL